MNRFKTDIVTAFVVGMVALGMTGCGGATPSNAATGDPASVPAGQFVATANVATAGPILARCLQAYHQAESYQDQACVVLQYTPVGQPNAKPIRDEAKLAVAVNRGGLLGLKAYLVRAGIREGVFELTIGDEKTNPFSDQLLVRTPPQKLTLDWIYSDPMVERHLGGGLAGFPPQLDLFLNDKPLEFLMSDAAMSVLDGQEVVDGKSCDRVNIQLGPAKYVLWIDQRDSILRKMSLPQQALPPALTRDSASTPTLTIEFRQAKINQPIDWKSWEVPGSPDSKRVRQLVLSPPPLSSEILGKSVGSFALPSPVQLKETNLSALRFNSDKPRRPITILAWLADHPACQEAAAQLARFKKQIANTPQASQVEVLAVWAEPTPPQGMSWNQLAAKWELADNLVLDPQAFGRDLFGVNEAPTIIALGQGGTVQYFQERANPYLAETLISLTTDILAGRNPAQIAIREYQYDLDRYHDQLRAAACTDSAFVQDLPIRAYPPRLFQSSQLWQKSVSQSIVALTAQTNGETGFLTLSENALVEFWDDNGEVEKSIDISSLTGKSVVADHISLAPSNQPLTDQSSWMVVSNYRTCQAWLVNYITNQVKEVQFNGRDPIVDIAWLAPQTLGDSSWLAIVGKNGDITLIEPQSGKRLTGRSPKLPVALMPQMSNDGNVARLLIVQADGTLEPILRPGERVSVQGDRVSIVPASNDESPNVSKNNITRLAAFGDQKVASGNNSLPVRLPFSPKYGSWSWASDDKQSLVLAIGEQNPNEPVAILMNGNAEMLWHYPLAANDVDVLLNPFSTAIARDGSRYWSILSPSSTIHLVRFDGGVNDHFSIGRKIKSAILTSWDNRLVVITLTGEHIQATGIEPMVRDAGGNIEVIPPK